MVDRVSDLLRRQPHVHRLQDHPHHRDGKKSLENLLLSQSRTPTKSYSLPVSRRTHSRCGPHTRAVTYT